MATDPNAAQDPAGADARIGMRIEQVLIGPPHEGDTGDGIVLRTTGGDIPAIQHAAPDSTQAVIFVCGARGGFGGPPPDCTRNWPRNFSGNL